MKDVQAGFSEESFVLCGRPLPSWTASLSFVSLRSPPLCEGDLILWPIWDANHYASLSVYCTKAISKTDVFCRALQKYFNLSLIFASEEGYFVSG